MTTRLVKRQISGLEQFDEMRPGDTEQAGGALRRQLLVLRNQYDSPAQLHVACNVLQQSEDGGRQLQPLTISADESRGSELEHPIQFADLHFLGLGQGDRFALHGR